MDTSQKKKILIVEDDQLLALTLGKQLEEEGYVVCVAQDGEQGFEKYKTEHPDALVTDVMLPKKDGVEMLKDIHALSPDSTMPIIVLSNADNMEYVAHSYEHNAVAYILKSEKELGEIVSLIKEKLS